MHEKATDAGFQNIDEYLHATDPSHEQGTSELESAHALGMDVNQYIDFLTKIRDVPSTALRYTPSGTDAPYMRDYIGKTYRESAHVDASGDVVHEEMPPQFFDIHADDLGKKSVVT